MKDDAQLKSDVNAELAWDAAVNSTRVGVSVASGVVTLSGQVDSYLQKHAIERAVLVLRFVGNDRHRGHRVTAFAGHRRQLCRQPDRAVTQRTVDDANDFQHHTGTNWTRITSPFSCR